MLSFVKKHKNISFQNKKKEKEKDVYINRFSHFYVKYRSQKHKKKISSVNFAILFFNSVII